MKHCGVGAISVDTDGFTRRAARIPISPRTVIWRHVVCGQKTLLEYARQLMLLMQLGNLRAARRTAGPRGKGELVILFTALKVHCTYCLILRTHRDGPRYSAMY